MLSSALIYSPLLFVWSLKIGGRIRTLKSWGCFHLAAVYLTNNRKFEIFYRVENFFLIWFRRKFVTKQYYYLMNLNSPLGPLLTWLNHVLVSLVRTALNAFTIVPIYMIIQIELRGVVLIRESNHFFRQLVFFLVWCVLCLLCVLIRACTCIIAH